LPNSNSRPIAGGFFHLLLCCGLAGAQDSGARTAAENDKPMAGAAAESAAARVEEAQPSLYYLKDKHGNLQAVPGFTFEEFERLFRLQNQLSQEEQRPRYSIQQLSASGVATTDGAELTVQFRVLVREDHWVRVPLRFDGALLREPAAYQGPGEQFLHFEADGEGYVSWIHGQAGQQHQLTLKLLVPLATMGDETRLKLLLPRATSSELKLQVPLEGAVAKVSEGATLSLSSAAEGATEFTVLGLSGDFLLTWRKAGGRIAEVPTVLEASGAILAHLDGRGVDSDATLSVRSYGAAFDHFWVRLPPQTELAAGSFSGYTVVPAAEGSPAGSPQRLVEVRLTKKTSGPIEVRLNSKRPPGAVPPEQWSELAGFEVVGAVRQWGTLAIAAPSDWQVLWGPSRGVRQVDQLPQGLRRDDVVAGFEYFAQPCSLTARLVPKKTRISAEPEYQLLVDADQVHLEAKLKYTVRGAKVFALDVGLPDWELDEVGPDNLVAVDGVAVNDAQVLSIPLLQPSTGLLEVRVRAHRAIAANAKSLRLPLPQPKANSLAPALLAVVAADNVELTPGKAMVGLTRESAALQITLPEHQQEPLFYRGEGARLEFAAGFRVHPQSISVAVASQVSLDEHAATVEQKLVYTIAHQPADHFTLEVPQELAGADGLEIQHDGKNLAATAADADEARPSAATVPMRFALPRACIGLCELAVRYPLPNPQLVPNRRRMLEVPLVMPSQANLTSNKLSVTAPPAIHVEPQPGPWSVQGNSPGQPARRGWQLAADRRAERIQLAVRLEAVEGSDPIVVDRAWVQTWLDAFARQDRAVFRFTSNRKELQLLMPAGAALSQMPLLLDGKRVTGQAVGEDRLVIPLSGDANLREHLLELQYHFPDPRPPRGLLSFKLPRLGQDVWIRRLYWQLVLPPDEHVIAGPAGFTGEFTWDWHGYGWGRKPLLEQSDLETWTAASHRTPLPEKTNRYLYSALGSVEECEVRTAGRPWIVLAASGAALVAGLLLIYVPAVRRPGTLLAAAMGLLCVGILYPEPTLLLSQAASLGAVLTLLAGILQRGVARRRRGTAFPPAAAVLAETTSTRSHRQVVVAGAQLSTETAPVVVPPPPPDANP
jgi:hypothetical protein